MGPFSRPLLRSGQRPKLQRIAHSLPIAQVSRVLALTFFHLPNEISLTQLSHLSSSDHRDIDQQATRLTDETSSGLDELVNLLPDNDAAVANWQSLRNAMFQQDCYQSTLTNFECSELENDSRRYNYEIGSFEPGSHDMLGFGPSANFYQLRADGQTALKTMNPESSSEYLQALKTTSPFWTRYFDFDLESFRLLYVTRQISKLTIQRDAYRTLLGTDVLWDFAEEWKALSRQNLIEIDDACIRLTAGVMSFSDTVASVLSHRHHAARLGRSTATRQFLVGNRSGYM